ncbi:MAG TPA: DUF1501 domain-containing protein [Isosphaeraceae bacterium]|jgi:hypothetical protein|nr:DUF1501 domain-containing protein [Isosphaeraceae bacterium]
MLSLPVGPHWGRCDGVRRRDFLQVGALAAFGLPTLLQAEVRADDGEAADRPKQTAQSVILVYLGGGLSHHDSFDPKPEAPTEVRGKYGAIATKLPGVTFGDKLERLAARNDRFALVRSGSHGNDHHETATNWVLSGRFGSPFGDYPAIGAVVAHELGYRGPLPPYFAVPRNPSFTWELGKSAFLGGRYESFKTGDPNDANFKVQDITPPAGLGAKLDRRQTLRAAVDGLAGQVEADDQLRTLDEFQRRAVDLILSPEARRAFDVRREDPRLRDRYGRTTLGQSCLLARRLVEAGVRFVTVNSGGWDHHAKIFDSLDRRLPELDLALSALLDDLGVRGLLESTLVVAFGEFGRSPKVNKDAGRDHWGHVASLVWAGGGVAPGRVVGRSDDQGASVTDRPVRPADVAWTIYRALGVDPTRHLVTPENRPVAILDEGAPIDELFA